MTILVVSEKPNAALKIASALSTKFKATGKPLVYELEHGGQKIIVAPAVGHVFGLKIKGKQPGYPVFDIEWAPAPEIDERSAYVQPYLDALAKYAKQADEIVNACDFDTEGSLIGYNVIRFLGKGKKTSRMRFSTLVAEELQEAFEKREPLDVLNAQAGETRHVLDWYWGINTSRALMSAIKKGGMFRILSIGRVQGPALAVLAKREQEIEAFKPQPYWQLAAHAHGVEFWHAQDKFFNEKDANDAFERANSAKANGKIEQVEKRKVRTLPPFPFDLTTLQIDAYRAFGYSPTMTLSLAQKLYEEGVTSYPRTSSQKLPPKLNLKKIVQQLGKQAAYAYLAGRLEKDQRFKPHEGEKSDAAHPAIHPTGQAPSAKLRDQERKMYDIIVKRFLASMAPDAKREAMRVKLDVGNEKFHASGSHVVEKGWLEFYQPYAKLEDVILPPFEEGQKLKVERIEKLEKETQPPKRYSQASLIKELEEENLGTKATRASIIQTLYDRGYITGRSIEATALGKTVYHSLSAHVPEIMSEQLTRVFEEEMEQIEKGKIDKEKVITEGRHTLEKILQKFKQEEAAVGKELFEGVKETQKQQSILGKCNKCTEGNLVIRKSRFGFFVGCGKYPECKNIFPLPRQALITATGKICEKCNTPMISVVRKARKTFRMCLDPHCETKAEWAAKREARAKAAEAKAAEAKAQAPTTAPNATIQTARKTTKRKK